MLQISKKSQYGLYLLILLSKQKENQLLSIKTIAKRLNLPYRFLAKIAAELKNADFIDSKEGVKGGYFLKKNMGEITLFEIVKVLDGPIGLIDCQLGVVCSREKDCKLKKTWDQARVEIEQILEKYNLNQFID